MKRILVSLVLSTAILSFESHAEFRCKGKLIDDDYSKLDVKKYCGEPAMVDSYTKSETITLNKIKKEISCNSVDQWYYSYGENQTTYIVNFERGFVVSIRQGRDKP